MIDLVYVTFGMIYGLKRLVLTCAVILFSFEIEKLDCILTLSRIPQGLFFF